MNQRLGRPTRRLQNRIYEKRLAKFRIIGFGVSSRRFRSPAMPVSTLLPPPAAAVGAVAREARGRWTLTRARRGCRDRLVAAKPAVTQERIGQIVPRTPDAAPARPASGDGARPAPIGVHSAVTPHFSAIAENKNFRGFSGREALGGAALKCPRRRGGLDDAGGARRGEPPEARRRHGARRAAPTDHATSSDRIIDQSGTPAWRFTRTHGPAQFGSALPPC